MKLFLKLFVFSIPIALIGAAPPDQYIAGKIDRQMPQKVTVDAGPRVENGIDAFITADFLYWTARVDNLGYVASGLGNNQTSVSKGTVSHPDWEWDPGFKTGLGLNLPHDGWEIYAQYTWLHSSATDKAAGNTLNPLWNVSNLQAFLTSSLLSGAIQSAHTSWKLHYNTVDLELARNYFISHYLSLRPYFGFRTSWQTIQYRVTYGLNFTDENGLNSSTLIMRNNPDFWGIGLRTGLNTSWHINPTFSIYGDFALSSLWSNYEVHRKDTREDFSNSSLSPAPPLFEEIVTYNTEDHFHTLTGVLELGIGLRAEWWFFENRYHLLVQGGWEEQLWINQNKLIEINFEESSSGDLVLQGLTIKLRFDF